MAKKKEVYSHPGIVKALGLITALFFVGTFIWNGVLTASGFYLDWGFYPNKATPNIVPTLNATTLKLDIPVYVNNTWLIGFDITDLKVDLNFYNDTGLITSTDNTVQNIPFGSNKQFNVSLVDEDNPASIADALANSTGDITMEIIFNVNYMFSSTKLNASIVLIGGLSFP